MDELLETLPDLVDVTAVMADTSLADIDFVCKVAKAYHCASTIANPCYLSYTIKNTIGYDAVLNGTTVGFPFGSELTSVKVYSAKQSELMGAQEIDMVMNVGAFLSGNTNYVRQDIAAVCESVKVPVKVIIEAALLNDAQIEKAALLVTKTGAAFVKTNTGLYQKPTTVEQVRIIKNAVGDSILIKASGGIRTVDDMAEMVRAGADRLGIGARSAYAIFKEIDRQLGRETPEIV